MVSYEIPPCESGVFWVVEPGDTLEKITQETGFPGNKIMELNPGINPQALVIGSKICLPEK